MSRDMNWETIIPRNTISICPTMTTTKKPYKRWTKKHTDENHTSPPPQDAGTMIRREGERRNRRWDLKLEPPRVVERIGMDRRDRRTPLSYLPFLIKQPYNLLFTTKYICSIKKPKSRPVIPPNTEISLGHFRTVYTSLDWSVRTYVRLSPA
jgi:hypothetical protein